MDNFQEKIDAEIIDLIIKYQSGEMELIDFALEVLNYAALESPHIAKRVNEILEGKKRPVGKPKTAPTELIRELRATGKTQESIAQELGVSLSTVRRELKS